MKIIPQLTNNITFPITYTHQVVADVPQKTVVVTTAKPDGERKILIDFFKKSISMLDDIFLKTEKKYPDLLSYDKR